MMKKIFLLLSCLCISAHIHAADGDLDTTTFGVPTGFLDNPAGDRALAVEVQTDGKIVVVGYDPDFNTQLVRYNPDGSLDLSFNGTGIGEQTILLEPFGLLIQPDGKIIVGGTDSTFSFFLLVRYNTNGTIDTSFGTSGYATGPAGFAQAIILQTDGKIIATGRYDAPFSPLGTVRFDADGNGYDSFANGPNGLGTDVVIQTDGKIIVAYRSGSFKLLRYNSDGTIDTTGYGVGGIATGPPGRIAGIVIQPNDYVIAGGSPFSSTDFEVARFDTTGNLDAAFGITGPGYTVGPAGFAVETEGDLLLQADGKIIIVGTNDTVTAFRLARYTDTGAIDGSFNNNNLPTGVASGGALQQDGKIIAVGRNPSFTFFRVARYQNSPILTDTQILVPTNGATLSAGAIEFSGNAQNPANIYIVVDGVTDYASSTITDPSPTNTWTLSATITTPGTHTIEIIAMYNDGNVNISDTITITIQSLTPPVNPTGTLATNKFLNTNECVLTITWQPSTSPNVVAYRIFRDGTQIAEIPATVSNTYTLCAATKFCTDCCSLTDFKNLTIASVNSDGEVSDVAFITTPCSPQPILPV